MKGLTMTQRRLPSPRKSPVALALSLIVTATALLHIRLADNQRDRDRGALTVEQALITAALLGLAGLLVTAITLLVKNKIGLIK